MCLVKVLRARCPLVLTGGRGRGRTQLLIISHNRTTTTKGSVEDRDRVDRAMENAETCRLENRSGRLCV